MITKTMGSSTQCPGLSRFLHSSLFSVCALPSIAVSGLLNHLGVGHININGYWGVIFLTFQLAGTSYESDSAKSQALLLWVCQKCDFVLTEPHLPHLSGSVLIHLDHSGLPAATM